MTKDDLITHLTSSGCIVIREDNKGYSVIRNVINGKMSGAPNGSLKSGHIRPATICRICRTLGVEIPEEAAKAADVIDHLHNNHGGGEN